MSGPAPSLAELDLRHVWHPFTQQAEWVPLVIARGDGCFLVDEQGRRYLDAVASLWCNVHGHNHPVLNRALTEQVATLAHSTFLGLSHEPGIRLAAALVEVAPPGLARVFYSDSGSTAVEIALKLSFQYWQLQGQPGKTQFVHVEHAYHGDTLGAVGVGGIELFHKVFGPLIVHSLGIPTPYRPRRHAQDGMATSLAALDELLATRAGEIAAVVMEPLIQGAAGMLTHPAGFLAAVAMRCRAAGVHLIVDEVATGFGRTGRMFACEHEGVTPDLLCLAKGISGGYLPLAATLTTEEIYRGFLGRRAELKHFFHGHTFTANPLACAVGLASLALLREGGLARSVETTGALTAAATRLAAHRWVREVRQVGMMVGIELGDRDADREFASERGVGAAVCAAARVRGVILRPLGDVLVWMPPLVISTAEIALLERATTSAIADVLGPGPELAARPPG